MSEAIVPQATDENSNKVSIELQPNFAADEAISVAFIEAGKHSQPDRALNAVVKAWCKLAKLALQTGQWMPRAPKIEGVSKVVGVEVKFYESYGMQALERTGLIAVSDKSAARKDIGEQDFEDWWTLAPARTAGGAPVKRGKKQARTQFFNQIANRDDYTLLTKATINYAAQVKGFAKDPERFLKGGFWRDYIPDGTDVTSPVEQARPRTEEVSGAELLKMMREASEGK